MPKIAIPEISRRDLEAFERDGVICLRSVFDNSWVERMQVAIDKAMAKSIPLSEEIRKGGRFLNDNFMWTKDADFRAFVFESPAAEMAAQVLKSEKINLLGDNLLVKEPEADVSIHWHNDQPYWPTQGWKSCTIWLPLDRISQENGGLRYIKSSHRWGKRLLTQESCTWLKERSPYEILFWDMEPGDCLIHHLLTIHSSPGNTSSTWRRALSTTWAGDDITLRATRFLKSANQLGISESNSIRDLKSSDPIDCTLFPMIELHPEHRFNNTL